MSAPPTFLTARGAGPRRRSRAWPEGRGLPWGRTRSGFRTNTAGRGTPRPAQLRASQNVGKPHVSLPWQNPSRTRTQDPQSLEPAPTERRAQQEAVSPNSPPICPPRPPHLPRSEKTEKLEELLGSRWSGSCLLLVRPTEQSRVPSPRCPSNTLGLCRVPGRTRSGPGQARSPPHLRVTASAPRPAGLSLPGRQHLAAPRGRCAAGLDFLRWEAQTTPDQQREQEQRCLGLRTWDWSSGCNTRTTRFRRPAGGARWRKRRTR